MVISSAVSELRRLASGATSVSDTLYELRLANGVRSAVARSAAWVAMASCSSKVGEPWADVTGVAVTGVAVDTGVVQPLLPDIPVVDFF